MKTVLANLLRSEPIRWEGDLAVYRESPTDANVRLRPPPTDPDSWSPLRRSHFVFYRDALAAVPADAVVLDVGAGERQFRALYDRFPNYVAMDFVPYEGMDIVCDLTVAWPLRDASVDVIVASNVFEHLPDTSAALMECARVLKPGGRLLIAVPFLLGVHQAPYDFVRHTHYGWRHLVEGVGLEMVSLEPSGTLYELQAVMRDKAHQAMYRTATSAFWRLGAKGAHRAVKLIEFLARPFVYARSPSSVDLALGYAIIVRKP